MATELKSLSGKIEIPNKTGEMKSDYIDTTVYLTRFCGGKKRGVSLQLSFLDEKGNTNHVQLDFENVLLLSKIISKEFL